MTKIKCFLFATATMLAADAIHAQESGPLLDLLVKKKILTDREAEEVRTELTSHNTSSAASKLKLSDSVTEMRFYGDGRMRYSGEWGKMVEGSDSAQRERWRYRLRLGVDVKLKENWMLGVELEAGPTARSANITSGDNPAFAKAGVGTTTAVTSVTTAKGVTTTKTGTVVSSVKWEDTLFVGRLFLKYNPTEWMAVEAGRVPNPFVGGNSGASGGMQKVWDPDINPQGFAEQFKYTIALGGSSKADGLSKAIAPASSGMTLDLFANFGQFVYEDVQENNFDSKGVQTPNKVDRWLLGFQAGAKLNFDKHTYLQIAPTFYSYTGGGDTFLKTYNGDGPQVVLNSKANPSAITFNQTGVNDLAVLDVPVEFGWTMWNTPFTIFGEFVDNFDAGTRAEKAGHPDKRMGIAYQAGLGVGKVKKKGDWELKAWWQHDEQYSLDPNINDDDIFNGRLNMEGFVVRAGYAFTDAASISLLYANGNRIDSNLGTGGASSLGSVPLQNSQLLFVDFNLKF